MNNTISTFIGSFKDNGVNLSNIISTIGNAISSASQWIITKLSGLGLNINLFTSKLITIFLMGIFIYVSTKLASKLWKTLLIILFLIIIACIGYTFFIPPVAAV